MRAAVIGSTGYVGVRLVARLLRDGHSVAALVRNPGKLAATGWAERVDAVHGDLDADDAPLAELVDGADVVYHLAHALDRPDFPERDQKAATRVADAASARGAFPRAGGDVLPHSRGAPTLYPGPIGVSALPLMARCACSSNANLA